MERKEISKRTRFEIFKRDNFTCQYCGKSTPSVILEVDHIMPVCAGGGNTKENLITACFDCNRGKAGIELTQITESLEVKAAKILEKEEQYTAFIKLQRKVENRLISEIERVSDIYSAAFPEYELSDSFKITSVKKFIEFLGSVEVESAMHVAISKCFNSDRCIKYFCGICWNKIKNGADYSPFN